MVLGVASLGVSKKAFFSGTDDGDDNGRVTVSGVVGKLTANSYDTVFRFNLPGNVKIKDLKVEDIFTDESNKAEVPAEWLSNVKREVYTAPKTTYYGGGYQGNRSTHTRGVVPNPNAVGIGRQTYLSDDDQEVLAQFGYPFALEDEGDAVPFVQRPLGKGRNRGPKKGRKTRLPVKSE